MLIFRQLFDQESGTYSYLLGDLGSSEAVLIDGVFEQFRRDSALIEELGLELRWAAETHCHADHVTSAWLLKEKFGAAIAVSHSAGISGADCEFKHGDKIQFGPRYLEVRATPGHTSGCVTFVLDDESAAFTGDTLLIRGCGRTDFQEGDPHQMYQSIWSQILSLPDNTKLYPAHDYRGLTATTVLEEKHYNPRCGGDTDEGDFVGYMDNLGLAHPKRLDIAVPANLRCGKPDGEGAMSLRPPPWGPARFTFAGIWEIDPQWVEENIKNICIVDVRDEQEFKGPLGHVPGAALIPIGELAERCDELDTSKPIITVCRSGARSAQATVILRRAEIDNVANLAGGMLRWRDLGLPTIGGAN
ncbi:MAG: MBL fold metallo-hydrolase [Pseudomonadota bacterium]